MLSMKMNNGWERAGITLENLSQNLTPDFQKQLDKDAELVLRALQNHIDLQDLSWKPLSKRTVALKGGNTDIYIETGELRKNLSIRKVKSSNLYKLFIGASPWKIHKPSGKKFNELMSWLEYGTDKIPPRPLIRPTAQEIEPILKRRWIQLLRGLILRKGSRNNSKYDWKRGRRR